MKTTSALLVLLLVAPLPAQSAADAVVDAIIEEGLQRSQVMDHLSHLTNRIGPRLTSSTRLNQACHWARDKFNSWGLDAHVEQWGTFPVGFNRGPWFGRMLEPKERSFTFATRAWSAGTTGRQRGEAILAPATARKAKRMAGKFAGKWVVEYPRKASGRRRRGRGGSWRGARMEPEARKVLDEMYAEEGVLGVIRTSEEEIVRTSGNHRITWDDLPTDVRITMIHSDWKALLTELERKKRVILEFDIRNHFKRGPIPLYNVIADIRGSEKPDEYVVVGGHLDSWDGATGTTDNGTGASSTLEAARILAASKARPKRTIRFMLWSGEEQGLLGSAAWCKAHQDELDRYSACFVHDGGTNYVGGISVTKHQIEDFRRAFSHAGEIDAEKPFEIAEVKGLRGGGSDHGSFLAHGVPGYFWRQKGKAVYGYGWHTQNDTYDIAVPEYQRHTATVVALGAYGVANLPHLLSREEMRSTAERPRQNRVLGVQLADGAMKVTEVTADSVGARAGLAVGDVLLEVDGVSLKDRFVLRNAINNGEPKKKLLITRRGKRVTLNVEWTR